VTRLVEFSPFGQLFTLEFVLKNTHVCNPILGASFVTENDEPLPCRNTGWAYGDFFTKTSDNSDW
jgi:hypothetical protein